MQLDTPVHINQPTQLYDEKYICIRTQGIFLLGAFVKRWEEIELLLI